MRYHGNYCGPNWSAGVHQASVTSDVEAIDVFDATCKQHDAVYALGGDVDRADQEFYESNIGQGIKRSAAALAVKLQQVTRNKNNMSNQRLRGAKGATTNTNMNHQAGGKKTKSNAETVTAPSVIGTILRGTTTSTKKKTADTLHMSATVCVGRPSTGTTLLTPELNGLIVLNPVSLGSDEIQNMTRVYQRYRMLKARLHYRPIVSTATNGETIVISNCDPNFKPVDTSLNSSFYQRALSTNHSALTPVWMPLSMDLDVDTGIKVCDNLNSSTLEDFCSGIVYTYTDGTTASPGYFLIDVDIEFIGLRFNPRNLISGSRQGYGIRTQVSFTAPVTGAPATSVNTGFTGGDIYLAVLTITASGFGAGMTKDNLFTMSTGTGVLPFSLDGSTTLYARAMDSTNLAYFTTYDAAVGYDVADKLLYGVTAPGTATINAVMTQLRNSTQPTL